MTKLQEIKNIPRIFLLSALLEFACTRPLFFWLTSMLLDWLGPRLQAVSDSLCIKSTSHDWSRFLAFAKAGVRFSWKGRHIIRPWWFQDEKKITRFYSCVFKTKLSTGKFQDLNVKVGGFKSGKRYCQDLSQLLGSFLSLEKLRAHEIARNPEQFLNQLRNFRPNFGLKMAEMKFDFELLT